MPSWRHHWLQQLLILPFNNHHSHLKPYQPNSRAMSANNVQQSSGLSTRAPGFNPSGHLTGPGMPACGLNVESTSQMTVAVAQGGYMSNNVFVTTRGDRIGHLHGHRPVHGRTGPTPYPTVQEVGEQPVCGFK